MRSNNIVGWLICLAACGSVTNGKAAPDSGDNKVTVTVAVSGLGSVTSDPSGVNCSPDCTLTVDKGTQVTLTPTGTLLAWAGGCTGTGACTLTATADVTVAASFATTYALTVATSAAVGTTVSMPEGIACGSACAANFAPDTMVTLTQIATSSTVRAGGWDDPTCMTLAPCVVTMNATKTVKSYMDTMLVDTAPVISSTTTANNSGLTTGVSATAALVVSAFDQDMEITTNPTQVEFVIFDGASHTLLYKSDPVNANVGRQIVHSPPMHFLMTAGTIYQMGSIVAGTAIIEYDQTVENQNGLTTHLTNGNPTNFAAPTLGNNMGVVDGRLQIYGHLQ